MILNRAPAQALTLQWKPEDENEPRGAAADRPDEDGAAGDLPLADAAAKLHAHAHSAHRRWAQVGSPFTLKKEFFNSKIFLKAISRLVVFLIFDIYFNRIHTLNNNTNFT
jgi:hypothetical protein